MSRTWLKWMPAVAVPAVIVAGVLAVPLQAGAAVDLPDKTPQDVLELAAGSTVDTFSGTLEQTSELGLPDIPSTGDAAAGDLADALDLLTGDHTVRVYQNGSAQSRVQVQDTMSERNLIRNGSDVWLYDSADNTAVHTTLPADAASSDGAETGTSYTPSELAQTFLAEVTPTTGVSLAENSRVAGRDAYELVLTPNTDDTLVGSVSISVDSETGLPLRVQVDAQDATEPAISVAFTTLSLDAPPADLFAFTPPAGASRHRGDPADQGRRRSPRGGGARCHRSRHRMGRGRGPAGRRGCRCPGRTDRLAAVHPGHRRRRRRPGPEHHPRLGADHRRRPGLRRFRPGRAAAGRRSPGVTPAARVGDLAIETRALTKRFGHQLAVDAIDLAVPMGSVFGFLGPNGSGKTTSIRVMLGLAAATSGAVRVLGESMPTGLARVLPQVGALVEGPAFYPFLSGAANLRRFDSADRAAPAASRRARVDRALERVGLSNAAGKKVSAYSLGMKQRLGIANALLMPRRLLVLDEPTNGLDPQGTREVRALVRSLAGEGTTVFVSSHLLAEVEQMCTHAAITSAGRLVAQGTLDELRAGESRVRVRTPDAVAAIRVLAGAGLAAELEPAPHDRAARSFLDGGSSVGSSVARSGAGSPTALPTAPPTAGPTALPTAGSAPIGSPSCPAACPEGGSSATAPSPRTSLPRSWPAACGCAGFRWRTPASRTVSWR